MKILLTGKRQTKRHRQVTGETADETRDGEEKMTEDEE